MDRRLLILIVALVVVGVVWYLVPMQGTETTETAPAPATETTTPDTTDTPATTTP